MVSWDSGEKEGQREEYVEFEDSSKIGEVEEENEVKVKEITDRFRMKEQIIEKKYAPTR